MKKVINYMIIFYKKILFIGIPTGIRTLIGDLGGHCSIQLKLLGLIKEKPDIIVLNTRNML